MHTDDRYRAHLQVTISALHAWATSIADVATIIETNEGDYWRIAIEPHVDGAALFDLVLRADGLHDLTIGNEDYEDQRTDDLDTFLPLAEAVARGRVVQHLASSTATGRPVYVETVVTLDDGPVWQKIRTVPRWKRPVPADGLIVETRQFLPYRRA